MNLTPEQIQGLGIGLNESTLLGLEVDAEKRIAAATFAVLTLPDRGDPPEDTRVQFIFSPVGRVVASLRLGRWDDLTAKVIDFPIEELLQVTQTFGGLPIYSWEFFDVHDKDFSRWANRLSLDWQRGTDGRSHSITLFQEGNDRHLDVCLWFDDLAIRDAGGQSIGLDDFIAGGRRRWDGLYSGRQSEIGARYCSAKELGPIELQVQKQSYLDTRNRIKREVLKRRLYDEVSLLPTCWIPSL